MHGKISIKAYPTREFGEMVWAYFGPREVMPELPQLEHGLLPASQRYVTKRLQQCNWAQSMDGAVDTAHFSFLHMPAPASKSNVERANIAADENRIRWLRNDPMPRFTIVDHDVGFVVGGARKADGKDLYWRITQFMLPTHSITPSAMPGEIYYGYTWVPVDDESCWIYVYGWHPDRRDHRRGARELRQGRLRPVRRARAGLRPAAQPLERLPDRPRGAEEDLLHRHPRHRRAGHHGAGKPGRRSPTARKEHLTRHRHRRGALPPPDAEGSEERCATARSPPPRSIPESYRLRSGGAVLSAEACLSKEVMEAALRQRDREGDQMNESCPGFSFFPSCFFQWRNKSPGISGQARHGDHPVLLRQRERRHRAHRARAHGHFDGAALRRQQHPGRGRRRRHADREQGRRPTATPSSWAPPGRPWSTRSSTRRWATTRRRTSTRSRSTRACRTSWS